MSAFLAVNTPSPIWMPYVSIHHGRALHAVTSWLLLGSRIFLHSGGWFITAVHGHLSANQLKKNQNESKPLLPFLFLLTFLTLLTSVVVSCCFVFPLNYFYIWTDIILLLFTPLFFCHCYYCMLIFFYQIRSVKCKAAIINQLYLSSCFYQLLWASVTINYIIVWCIIAAVKVVTYHADVYETTHFVMKLSEKW